MTSDSKTDLTALTENQKGVLKVLADADGDALTGPEVRERLRDNYGIDLTMRGMNGVIRRNSNYPPVAFPVLKTGAKPVVTT